jgi:hypothetical protein
VGKRIIKKSYWYLMEAKKQNTTPQTNEDIMSAEWMSLEKFFSKKRQVYPNILEVLHTQETPEDRSKVQIKIK